MKSPLLLMRICLATALGTTLVLFAALLQPVPPARTATQSTRPSVPVPQRETRPLPALASSPAPYAPMPSLAQSASASTPNFASFAELQEENRKLRAANALLQERLQAVLNWILANFRGRFPLPESLFGRVQISPLTENDVLNPELRDLLRLSSDEEERLNDALAYALDYLSEIESAILTATEPRAGKIILHIPTFRENGQILKEDLYAALEATLGPERFARFLKVAENGLRQRFYRFGEASRTIVFELTYGENDANPRLLIKDGLIWEIEPGVREIIATEILATNIPPKYAGYLAWLPDYFPRSHRMD